MNLPGGSHFTHGVLGCLVYDDATRNPAQDARAMASAFNTSRALRAAVSDSLACHSTGPIAEVESSGFATIVGSPRWSLDHLQQIALSNGHAKALTQAYAEYGEAFLQYLKGAFSFALFDPTQDLFIAGTDRLSQFPMYYHHDRYGLIFGPTAGSVLAHPSMDRKLLDQGIYNYVYFHMVPGPDSIFTGLKKLQLSQHLRVSGGSATV